MNFDTRNYNRFDRYDSAVWEDWFSDDTENDDEQYLRRERRQYKMLVRVHLEKWDDFDFQYRFRVSKHTFSIVLSYIKNKLEFESLRSRYIEPDVQLLIALRFYALGTMQVSIADFAGVSISSVCRILKRVSKAIASVAPQFIKMPRTHEELVHACKGFYLLASFPRTIGAIDCTHVRIESPGGAQAEHFRNRKGFFSINVQTIAAADLKINSIVARWPGATHDQRIFNNSAVKWRLENGEFGHFIIVGDSGYQNTMYLATCLSEPATPIEVLYNESQIRTRNVVERSYGVLKRRFPVLSLGMRVHLETVQDVIISCAVMHNICIDQNDPVPPVEVDGFEDMLAETMFDQIADAAAQSNSRNAPNVRSELLEKYFPALLRNHVCGMATETLE